METHAPRVRCMKRKSDVCSMCDQLRDRVSHARTEEEIQKAMQDLTEHMEQAQMESDYYRSSIAAAKDSLATTEDTIMHNSSFLAIPEKWAPCISKLHSVCSCLA